MTCREFTKKVEGFTLAELNRADDVELLSHERECVACAGWFQQRHALAGAMQALRSSTATMQAPVDVECEVLRAFRQSSAVAPVSALGKPPQPLVFRLSRFFEWGAYAAVAAALAISIGLGLWFLQHSGKTPTQSAQPQATKTEQPIEPKVVQPDPVRQSADVQTPSSGRNNLHSIAKAATAAQSKPAVSSASLTLTAQAQGYTPLMLCDPLSCSGDEQVVRMELPASAADGSAGSQMADVVVGDDGLVRAIRIVQQ